MDFKGFNLFYKNQSVNMYKEIIAVFSDIHTKHCRNSIITLARIDKVEASLLL